mmetsp:Transcript_4391/g.11246  ORF Transcript_4391/g.11246 Transcript_4391/m.11246 type:complete len:107 (+) Transcript_4391:150-470(+)
MLPKRTHLPRSIASVDGALEVVLFLWRLDAPCRLPTRSIHLVSHHRRRQFQVGEGESHQADGTGADCSGGGAKVETREWRSVALDGKMYFVDDGQMLIVFLLDHAL